MAKKISKKPLKIKFNLSPLNYLRLLKYSFLNPLSFTRSIPTNSKFIFSLGFFIINICAALTLRLLIQIIIFHKGSFFFFAVSEAVVIIPFFIFTLLLATIFLHLLLKLAGGKAKLSSTFSALALSSGPVIFGWIPLVSFLSLLLFLFLLTLSLKNLHQISYLRAILILVIPLVLLFIISLISGLINFLLLFIVGRSFV